MGQRYVRRNLDSEKIAADDLCRIGYFAQTWKVFPNLMDRKLINMVPDLLSMDHVQVDACILLIYYCILWQGCFTHSNTPGGPDGQYIKQIYICCLRTVPIWRREDTGSVTDFIAAIFMVCTVLEAIH